MRALALLPLLLAASCGDDAAVNKAASGAAAALPSPGQWEVTSQVTRFMAADQGPPSINTPVGTRTTQSVCVAPGTQLPSAMLAGEGFTCGYSTYYVRAGRANATLNCRREGVNGDIPMTVNGTFAADTISLHRNLRTALPGNGDVQIEADISGRRTGACTAAAASEGQNRQ